MTTGPATIVSESSDDFIERIRREVVHREVVHRRRVVAGRIAVAVTWLGSWQFTADRFVDSFFSSSPLLIVAQLQRWIVSNTLWGHMSATLQTMAIGLTFGAIAGIVVGFLLGRSPRTSFVVEPIILVFYSLPRLALAPLFVLWFGIGMMSKIVLCGVITFFLVFYSVFSGARNVQVDLINQVRVMGASKWQVYRTVVVPASTAWIITGLRIAVPYSLVGAVVGELISSNRGLGYLVVSSTGNLNTTGAIAAVLVISVIAVVLTTALNSAQQRLAQRGYL
jgi:NitT/TauT family transport system permease protein